MNRPKRYMANPLAVDAIRLEKTADYANVWCWLTARGIKSTVESTGTDSATLTIHFPNGSDYEVPVGLWIAIPRDAPPGHVGVYDSREFQLWFTETPED